MKRILIPVALGFTILISQPELIAQGPSGDYPANDRPSAQARFVDEPPLIDGDIREDPVWQDIEPITTFIQTRPSPGAIASERTEIRIAYDDNTFYFSAVCHDSDPQRLVVSDSRRDASLDNTDGIQFILDTYDDGQNGFIFGTNSIGIEYDAQVDNEGEGNFNPNRQQGGELGGFNLNWDASWEVKTEVGDYGWSAEFAIPLRTLRYNAGEDQTWGLNIRRNIRKTNEIVYWAPLPIEFDLKRLSLAGKLTGLDLESPGNLKLIPYALTQIAKDYQVENAETEVDFEIGGDIKWSITPSLTLDLTYNTDFAQVEVDEQQVNLDRFNLFFPEKRPFFLENAGLFSVGSPGEVDLFFSRRIGIGEGGQLVPIIGGARLTGKLNRTNIGFLSMFTDDVSASDIQENNFTVARVNQEFAKRSAVGAIFVNREGLSNLDEDYNRVFAADAKVGLGEKARLTGFVAKSSTSGAEGSEHAYKLQYEYEWTGWNFRLAYTEVGEGFNPEVGFLFREAFRKPEFLVLYHWRMHGKWGLLELRPHISYRGFWDFSGFQETGFLHVDNHWEWENGLEIHTGVNFTREGVVEAFNISDEVTVTEGTYDHSEAQIIFQTNSSKSIFVSTRHVMGGFFGGERYAHSGTMGIRIGDKFTSEWSLAYNDIRLPGGNFSTTLFGSRLSYSFTPRIFVQSLIQYNSVIDNWSANVRLGWLQQANTGLFVVYNESRGDGLISNRSFTVKYSLLLDLLK
jgi:hypothetical protein